MIGLALLADAPKGGWPTFTAHLAHGLMHDGENVLLFKYGAKTENKPRDFGRGLEYRNVSADYARGIADAMPVVITAVDKKHLEQADDLLRSGASIVIHDPTELKGDVPDVIRGHRVIAVRRVVQQRLAELGVDAEYVPHPYARIPRELADQLAPEVLYRTVAYSRLDFDKATHDIVAANLKLPADRQIHIFGAENRLYTHHKVTAIDPDWRRNYHGDWPAKASLWQGVAIAASARSVVDLSAIVGDGGGTQYSFLEALDASRPLIISKKWLTGDPELDEIVPAVAAVVDGVDELVTVLMEVTPAYDTAAAEALLQEHDATRVAKRLLKEVVTA